MTAAKVLAAMRWMAWERAKGELRSMGQASFMPDTLSCSEEVQAYEEKSLAKAKLIEDFISEMESVYM